MDRLLPLGFLVLAEDQIVVGIDVEPGVRLDLLVELSRPPARIAENEQAVARAAAVAEPSAVPALLVAWPGTSGDAIARGAVGSTTAPLPCEISKTPDISEGTDNRRSTR